LEQEQAKSSEAAKAYTLVQLTGVQGVTDHELCVLRRMWSRWRPHIQSERYTICPSVSTLNFKFGFITRVGRKGESQQGHARSYPKAAAPKHPKCLEPPTYVHMVWHTATSLHAGGNYRVGHAPTPGHYFCDAYTHAWSACGS